jgi:hypothetical protein
VGDYIDESDEAYEDTDNIPDKDEIMPSMFQEKASPKPIHKVMGMPKLSFSKQRLDDINYKSDKFREKNDIRPKPNKELSTYQKVHLRQVNQIEMQYLDRMLPEVRINRFFKYTFD